MDPSLRTLLHAHILRSLQLNKKWKGSFDGTIINDYYITIHHRYYGRFLLRLLHKSKKMFNCFFCMSEVGYCIELATIDECIDEIALLCEHGIELKDKYVEFTMPKVEVKN